MTLVADDRFAGIDQAGRSAIGALEKPFRGGLFTSSDVLYKHARRELPQISGEAEQCIQRHEQLERDQFLNTPARKWETVRMRSMEKPRSFSQR